MNAGAMAWVSADSRAKGTTKLVFAEYSGGPKHLALAQQLRVDLHADLTPQRRRGLARPAGAWSGTSQSRALFVALTAEGFPWDTRQMGPSR